MTVERVRPGSTAELYGVQTGWSIYKVNGTLYSNDGIFNEMENSQDTNKPDTITITFQVYPISTLSLIYIFEPSPMKDRVVWFNRTKIIYKKKKHIQIIRKLKVDEFTRKKRRSRPKIVDLAGIGHFCPIIRV